MIKIIKNAEVYSPSYLGKKDVLIAGGVIENINDSIEIKGNVETEIIDGEGKVLVPGFIDGHVHILGGGGEGSYKTRTPEIMLSNIVKYGVTTVIGCIGTDGITRTMPSLVAKCKGLKEEGISCYILSGSYDVPVRTLTGSIKEDMLFIEEIIGVGEIALSDHRSSQPLKEEITRIIADTRVAGMLSGKGGIVQIHLGDGNDKINMLNEIIETTTLPIKHLMPTHVNRNKALFAECIEFAKKGGAVDMTISPHPYDLGDNQVKCSKGLKEALEAGVPIERITFSSDAQGSLPKFNDKKELIGLGVGNMEYLFKEVADAVKVENIPLEEAVKVITLNPAQTFNLKGKGEIKEGFDADFVLLDKESLAIDGVIAKGQTMVRNKEVIVKGTFE